MYQRGTIKKAKRNYPLSQQPFYWVYRFLCPGNFLLHHVTTACLLMYRSKSTRKKVHRHCSGIADDDDDEHTLRAAHKLHCYYGSSLVWWNRLVLMQNLGHFSSRKKIPWKHGEQASIVRKCCDVYTNRGLATDMIRLYL